MQIFGRKHNLPHMNFKIATFNKTTIAHLTLIRFEAAVSSSVQIKCALSFKRLRAHLALEWTLSGVYLSILCGKKN